MLEPRKERGKGGDYLVGDLDEGERERERGDEAVDARL
jgi:hypothetical protein